MIYFFYETNFFFTKKNRLLFIKWILLAIKNEVKNLKNINFIFCNDEYLFKLNQKYLNHNNYTDVITFNYTININILYGDIFISIDRVIENAYILSNNFNDELKRVMIHAILHLSGYDDKSKIDRKIMHYKENFYIKLFHINYK
ncbi:MAG: rRNA maturation RNase YbeY [Candidatus Bostrichicola ureolyticus]|nr:MAG: rRNA maturation RNase YbeY [Candidatus Bostrichicola ureolyticus]